MKNSFNQVNELGKENLSDLFLKDSQADILVIFNDRIFPMRKNLLKKSAYFDRKMQNKNKIYVKEL